MTTTHHLNETPLERELQFLDRHIERLERKKERYDDFVLALAETHPDEDERNFFYREMTDLEIELVLLEACADRKQRLENEQDAIKMLDSLTGQGDIETDHSTADGILLSMVPSSVSDAYKRLVARSRWWAHA